MVLIPVFLIAVACFIFYSASKRAVYRRSPLNKWFLSRPLLSKVLTIILLTWAFILFIRFHGLGVGVFLGLVTLMTIYGLILLFYPLASERKVKV